MRAPVRAVGFCAALLALSAVVLGALGSHMIDMKGLQDSWQTASIIHLFNAAALVGLAALLSNIPSRLLFTGTWIIILGTVVFSGSIYLHIISGRVLSGLTPLGGMLMMAGWFISALAFLRRP